MEKIILEQEKLRLAKTIAEIDKIKKINEKKIEENIVEIRSLIKFFSDHYYDIRIGHGDGFVGEDEFANLNISIENLQIQNDNFETETRRLTKQRNNPYFGRFDFKENNQQSPSEYYIGLGLVQDEMKHNLVLDWRADICSLYYEDTIGKTSYSCRDGQIDGEVFLKRQFKVEKGNLLYYIDSNMIIDDEILMEQLSKNSTSKMHDIVSTIQKEQNKLIRSEDFENIIVQGVAGSGKTSIAMHRISYLLYKYRNQMKSDDILILSPSELFADYIDEVLPNLGEDKPFSTTFSNLAKKLLGLEFETRETMLERVISKQNQKDFENIAIKSSFEFLNELKNFLNNDMSKLFIPKTITFGNFVLSEEDLADIFFNKLKSLSIFKRIDIISENIVEKFKIPSSKREDLMKRVKFFLYNKFLTTDILKIYNLFLRSIDLDEIETIGAYDIAPLLLIKENLFSLKNYFDCKYLIVDEMQDYTPCQFYLFDKIWECKKLYLGDIYQSIDKTLSPEYLTLLAQQTSSTIKFLNKSYRSTLQISIFSQKILGKHIANNVNRNGEEVEFIKTKNCSKAIESIITKRNSSNEMKNQSIAIICKTKDEIAQLQKSSQMLKKFKVLDNMQSMKSAKRVITTPAKAKGVEFDCVIVPFANEEVYHNQLDRNLLYVAATRALHKLIFVSDKKPSKFLLKNSNN